MNLKDLKKGEHFPGVCVVFFCHDGKGKYLFNLRSKNCRDEHGRWDPGGGGVKTHDTVENTLRKEIQEEYCTDIIEYEFLGYRDVHRTHNGRKTHWIALDFKVQVNPKSVCIGEPEKCEKLEWFTINNLPTPLHSEMNRCLKLYQNKF